MVIWCQYRVPGLCLSLAQFLRFVLGIDKERLILLATTVSSSVQAEMHKDQMELRQEFPSEIKADRVFSSDSWFSEGMVVGEKCRIWRSSSGSRSGVTTKTPFIVTSSQKPPSLEDPSLTCQTNPSEAQFNPS